MCMSERCVGWGCVDAWDAWGVGVLWAAGGVFYAYLSPGDRQRYRVRVAGAE